LPTSPINYLTPFDQLISAAALIVAVAHQEYRGLTPDQLKALTNGNPIVIDVKGLYERQTLAAARIRVWRL